MTTAVSVNPHGAQLLRYLTVGACNTIFGYGCYALFTMLLTPTVAYGYVVAIVLANFFSINFAFLGYKWFVFKSKGNYFKEWVRCLGVYATTMVASTAALPFVVAAVRRETGRDHAAPYIAGAIVLAFTVGFSFVGHRWISFGVAKATPQDAP